ncbi:MAG TPA: fatty acyl-AMP ligase [Polyangiaceae bacterium]|jgi:fatty-acyl-CoA synthase|nr:fatty acyl-AMP ligase [Polyangiaceae bacterium]
MRTFVEVLRDNAVYREHAHTFVRMDGTERVVSYPELWCTAVQRACRLRELGLQKGDRLAIILPEPDDFVLAFVGAITAGVVPVPMYPPLTLAKMEAYGETVRHILDASGANVLVTVPGLASMLSKHLGKTDLRVLVASDLEGPLPDRLEPPCQVGLDDLAFLQFTSGSTRKPKGVMVTHRNLSANAHAIMFDGLRATPQDRGVSWLPLFHDMGLIGFVIAPLYALVQVMFLPTMNFIRRPSVWLDAIHRFRGTITFAPNFAFALATRAIRDSQLGDWDLSCLKAVGCGAEPIQIEVLRAFVDRFAPCGLKPEALLPCYGLAEATLAVSFIGLDQQVKIDRVDADAMKCGRATPVYNGHASLELVSVGRPFRGHELSIVDEDGKELPERVVGHVLLRGPSVTRGYFDQPEDSAEVFHDGWLRTGDLGYLADGELYICGRAKDLIIINGKNYYPQDIERIASEVHGIRQDQCVAISRPGKDGTEECVLIAESVSVSRVGPQGALPGDNDADTITSAIKNRVRRELGITVGEVVLIKRNSMPKTSSGKVRRSEAAARLESATLELFERPPRRRSIPAPRPSAPAL